MPGSVWMNRPRLSAGWTALVLIVVASLPRWLWMQSFRWLPVSDSAWYHDHAVALAHGAGYSSQGVATAFMPVGYPAFLAGLFRLFPASSATVATANLLLGAGLALLSLWLYRELGLGRLHARLAALAVALCPTLILYTTLEMSDLLFTFLLVAATDCLLASRRHPALAAAAGLLFGAACLVRSQVLFLPAAMLCLIFAQEAQLPRLLRGATLAYLAMGCVVLPWTLRNWMVLGSPALVSTNDGYNLLLGNNPWQRWGSGYPPPPELAQDLELTAAERQSGTGEIAWDARLRAQGLAYLREAPLHYLGLVPRKLERHFSWDNETVVQNDMAARAAGDEIRSWPEILPFARAAHAAMLLGVLLALAAAALRDDMRWQICFCLLPAAYFAAISAVFFAEQRFNLPALPFLLGAALLGYVQLAELAFARRRGARALRLDIEPP